MANMNFGVNILPKANNTYTLGNSDYKWNIFANTLNGQTILSDVQVNSTSIVNNGIANIPIATNTTPGVIIQGPGLTMQANKLWILKATNSHIKNGAEDYCPIVPASQHTATFYGLAKAAGDSTQSASSNAVGTYTDSAKTAIQNMLAVAPTANPVFTGSISLGRDANSTVGLHSIAIGYANCASGNSSVAMGAYNYANTDTSMAVGYNNMAMGAMSFAGGLGTRAHGAFSYTFGLNTANDIPSYTNWTASTSYAVGDNVVNSEDNLMYTCIEANSDATFNYSKWVPIVKSTFIEKIGNGELNIVTGDLGTPSNARALDWNGNEYLNGDLYINCNNDSTGGIAIGQELNKKANMVHNIVEGNPCTFESEIRNIPLKSIKLNYQYIQEGSGDPSPTNIRNIVGISDPFIAQSKKNMATLRGYSAANMGYDMAGTLTNSYGTTISTTDPESSVTITQSSTPRSDNKSHYENGYFSIRTDNMVDDQYYDMSIKVTDITSNPLEADLSNFVITSPSGNLVTASEVIGNVIIWHNFLYKDTNGRQAWEVRICGMSCTVSEFMVTPAYTNDGVYEPYDGVKLDITFPVLGKNLCNTSVDNTVPFEYSDYDNYTISNGTVHITGNTLFGIKVPVTPSTKYRWSFDTISTVTVEVFDYATEPDKIRNGDHTCYYDSGKTEGTITVPSNKNWILFAIYTTQTDVTISNLQIELGETTSSYEPYNNSVYGGSLDLVSGVLNVTYGCHTFTGDETFNYLETKTSLGMERHIFNTNILDNYAARNSQSSFCASTAVRTGSGNSSNPLCFYNGTPTNQFAFYIDSSLCEATADSFKAWLAEHPCQVVFPLKEPFDVQLTPEQIKTFKGINTIWANTNGPIEIENYIDLETIREYADNAGVQDVQINGTSIVNNNVATIPIATASTLGVVSNGGMGVGINSSGHLYINYATDAGIKAGTSVYNAITAGYQHQSAFYGLAKAAGDSTQSTSSNAIGIYTDGAKIAIQKMLGIYSAPWEVINEEGFTNAEEADYTITTDSNGNPFELTDIRMIFELPKLSTGDVASSKGNYGQVWFYFGTNDYLVAEPGSFNRAAGDSGKGCWYFIEYKDNMVTTTFSIPTTNTNANNIRVRYNTTINGAAADNNMGMKVISNFKINKIVIKSVIGNGRYKLYGKRKWT